MGAAASSPAAAASSAAAGADALVLLAPVRPVGRWAAVTDGTARGGDTRLAMSTCPEGGADAGALRLQGSLGALEAAGGQRLVGFAIADCPIVTASPLLGTQGGSSKGLRLSYRHDPPDARFQLRLLTKGLAPQESFVAPLKPAGASSTTTTTTIPWSAFRLQYRGRPVAERAAERVDPSGVTSIGIEITRSTQPPPLYARVPLPFEFLLFPPGIEGAP